MKKIFLSFFVIVVIINQSSAQSYLPLTGGTLTGSLSVGNSTSDQNLFLFKRIGPSGTSDYIYVGQHSLPFQIYNTTSGLNNRKIEMGVLDNGTAVLQANAAGEGYFPIHLNPVSGGVLIGCGNAMTTSYTLQVGGASHFNSTASFDANVGIGITNPTLGHLQITTATNNPAIELDGAQSGWGTGIQFNNTTASTGKNYGIYSGADGNFHFADNNMGTDRILISSSGNVGIGTTNPQTNLDVTGTFQTLTSTNPIRFTSQWSGFPDNATNQAEISNDVNGYKTLMIVGNKSAGMGRRVSVWDRLEVNGTFITTSNAIFNSNVGIGTTNPTEKLSVNGNIRSKKLIVTQTGWSDYVFDTSYQLQPLSQVEQFIKTNKHLPDVPSAKEVATDGIDVGDNQALLLKKIEELTLYMIEMKKENALLKQRIEKIENK